MCVKVVNGSAFDMRFAKMKHFGEMRKKGAEQMTGMLMGTYSQSIDVKGRMAIPAKLREAIGERLIITKGVGGCLFVYAYEDFLAKAAKLNERPMASILSVQRSFMANAGEVETDKQGRVLIPANLRTVAALEKEALVVGVSDHCEIWNPERWEKLNESFTDEMFMQALEGADF